MSTWVAQSLNTEQLVGAQSEAVRRLLNDALHVLPFKSGDENLQFTAEALELAAIDALTFDEDTQNELTAVCIQAFQLFRVLNRPEDPIEAAKHCLRMACLGILADRGAEVLRVLKAAPWPDLPLDSDAWDKRTFATILDSWLCLLRKDGWSDLDRVLARTAAMRVQQAEFEARYLARLNPRTVSGKSAGWQLVAIYHLARAADLLATYTTHGQVEGTFDIRQQLEAQFDRVFAACDRGGLTELDTISRLLLQVSYRLVDNSVWTIARSAPKQITDFVEALVSRGRSKPIFELLPPQRQALSEAGLLAMGRRSVVVSLPTSSGKTFIAQFRMLQALNQFSEQRGWVAYLAPTRALVNQVFRRLRQDFVELGINVERVSPALEIDMLEANALGDQDESTQFRVLVTTPEKFDLLIRGGWEQRISRPLCLIIVDEAHNLSQKERGIKLELLLSTINRECKSAQFLLLTPFIHNAQQIARWLDPRDNQDITLGLDWQPNDRVIALARAKRGSGQGTFQIDLEPVDTTKTLFTDGSLPLGTASRYLGLTYASVRSHPSKLAATTAEILKSRGPVIVLANKPDNAWYLAGYFKHANTYKISSDRSDSIRLVQDYLRYEFGEDFALIDLLNYGVGVHHAGLSDEVRELMEWLFETEAINVLVATTTIAQGVNFPISAVVLASHQYPWGQDMPPEDFWNLAGRAGRIDQGSVGIVALACTDDARAKQLRRFVRWQEIALTSNLTRLVEEAISEWNTLNLHRLVFLQPEWSAFLQFIAHTYRQFSDLTDFTNGVEQILRGTLGFQDLRRNSPRLAEALLSEVYAYGERISGRPLSLVDTTGWSWDSVASTMRRLSDQRISFEAWDPRDLFRSDNSDLRDMMGILLAVPELRENLEAATGGNTPDGNKLARMISDWVNGATLSEMAEEYFGVNKNGKAKDSTKALTDCCKNIYGKLTQTASWGLAALQAITVGDRLERLPEAEQLTVRNLPSRVYYGVNTDEAIAVRLAGVPRTAAQPVAQQLGHEITGASQATIRSALAEKDGSAWVEAMGQEGRVYYNVWNMLYGK